MKKVSNITEAGVRHVRDIAAPTQEVLAAVLSARRFHAEVVSKAAFGVDQFDFDGVAVDPIALVPAASDESDLRHADPDEWVVASVADLFETDPFDAAVYGVIEAGLELAGLDGIDYTLELELGISVAHTNLA